MVKIKNFQQAVNKLSNDMICWALKFKEGKKAEPKEEKNDVGFSKKKAYLIAILVALLILSIGFGLGYELGVSMAKAHYMPLLETTPLPWLS